MDPILNDVFENVKLIMNNKDLFHNVNEEDLFHSAVVRNTPYDLLNRNIKICRMFKLDIACKIKLSMLKNNLERKINYAIEVGLIKPPNANAFSEYDYLPFYQEFNYPSGHKIKHEEAVRNYYSNYIAKLMNLNDEVYAYYSKKILDVGFSLFYKDFFETNEFVGQHVDRDKELYTSPSLAFLKGEDAIERYSEYSDVIDKNLDKFYGDSYYDPSILSNIFIIDLEKNNAVYDEIIIDGNTASIQNEFLYKFNNKLISRYKVLKYASILKKKYGTVDKDMLLVCIIKDSFITDSGYINIVTSLHDRRRI